MSGWIALSRDIFKHDFFASDTMSEREAWIWMVAKAAWEDTHHRVGTQRVLVPRGSFYCTLRGLQKAWNWGSDKRVRTFLERTQIESITVVKTDLRKTHVTICNYDRYQVSRRSEDAQKRGQQTRSERIKEQVNKGTKEQSPPPPPRGGGKGQVLSFPNNQQIDTQRQTTRQAVEILKGRGALNNAIDY